MQMKILRSPNPVLFPELKLNSFSSFILLFLRVYRNKLEECPMKHWCVET